MANNMTVSDKNMTRKLMNAVIINHSVRHVSQKDIHVKMQAATKACDATLREKKKKDISKAIHRRGGNGFYLIGTDYLPDRDYNCPFFPEGFIHQQIYNDDMRWMTRRDWDNFQHEGDSAGEEDNDWRHNISDIDPEEEASPRSPCSGCGSYDDCGFSGDSCYED